MKTNIKAFRLLLLSAAMLVTTGLLAKSGDDRVEKSKSYSKSYSISSSDKIEINNQFGETRIELWNSNEIKVDAQIKVKANTESGAQRLLDDINIEDGKGGSGVYFKTHIEHNENGNKHESNEMHIDYVVHMPANNPFELDTRFGDTYLPDYSGPIEIENKFGKLVAGNLSNVKTLTVEFGKGEVQSMNNGKLTVKYSEFTMGKLSGDIDARFEFCDGGKITLDNGIKSFNLFNNYSTVKISTSKDLSATFDISTHFGDFANHSRFAIKEDSDKGGEWRSPKFDYHFSGKSGSGSVMVTVKSNFGTTTIM